MFNNFNERTQDEKSLTILTILISVAGQSIASTDNQNAASLEARCIQATVDRVAAIENQSDSFINGYINLLPELKNQQMLEMQDPSRCSVVTGSR